jgi:hypothetical protein
LIFHKILQNRNIPEFFKKDLKLEYHSKNNTTIVMFYLHGGVIVTKHQIIFFKVGVGGFSSPKKKRTNRPPIDNYDSGT